jgi:transposase
LSEIEGIDPDRIAYVDETGIDHFLHRPYARATRGEPVHAAVSGKKYKRTSVVAAQVGGEIIASMQYDGTMDSALFEAWFEKMLLPSLDPSTVIVMDNASFHRKSVLLPLAQSDGHRLLFLPPYSPELNPIEHLWAWLKQKLRAILPLYANFNDALLECFHVR